MDKILNITTEDKGLLLEVWMRQLFHARDPIAAWVVYSIARKLGEPIPDEVMAYFDDVAKRIIQVVDSAPARPQAALAAALGIVKGNRGRGGALASHRRFARDMQIWGDVVNVVGRLLPQHGERGVWAAAYEEVAGRHELSVAQVRRVFKRMCDLVPARFYS